MLDRMFFNSSSAPSTAWDLEYAYSVPALPWDISTASFTQSFSVVAQDGSPTGVFFKPDGTAMYVLGNFSDLVYQYSLSTAWDISTASYIQSFSVNLQDTAPQDIFFKPDGTAMYVIGATNDSVYQYSLSTAWDISTASLTQSFSVAAQDGSPTGVFFKSDGTAMYVIGAGFDRVYQYSLSTAWDITTASYIQNFSVLAQETGPNGVFFKSDGTAMYVIGATNDSVYQYSLSTAWDISTASFTQSFSVLAQDTAPQGVFFKPDGAAMYVVGATSDAVHQYTIGRFSVLAQDSSPTGVFFKPDGTAMYMVGAANDRVYQYSLSTAWDISTASFTQSFSVAAQDTAPQDIFFKPDGTVMYVVGATNDAVYQYSLSTAWDISTASFTQSFSVAAQDTTPTGVFFKPDGTVMYMVGLTNDRVYQYSLSTAWDISTASFTQSFSVLAQDGSPTGVFFKPDGTVMYVVGQVNDAVHQYSLSTAWDISTASYIQSFSVAAQDTAPTGVFFKPDGTVMYVIGATTDAVYQYAIGT